MARVFWHIDLNIKKRHGCTVLALFGVMIAVGLYKPEVSYGTMKNFVTYNIEKIVEVFQVKNLKEAGQWLYQLADRLIPSFLRELWRRVIAFALGLLSNGDKGDEVLSTAVKYREGDKVNISIAEAEEIVKSLKYIEYRESNMCDIFEGLSAKDFDEFVDHLASELGLTNELRRNFKMSRRGKKRMRGVESFFHRRTNGTLNFGRFAVVRRAEDEYDLAYSIHSLTYSLDSRSDENKKSLWTNFANKESTVISQEDGFFAYYQHKAIDRFKTKCAGLLVQGGSSSGPTVAETLTQR